MPTLEDLAYASCGERHRPIHRPTNATYIQLVRDERRRQLPLGRLPDTDDDDDSSIGDDCPSSTPRLASRTGSRRSRRSARPGAAEAEFARAKAVELDGQAGREMACLYTWRRRARVTRRGPHTPEAESSATSAAGSTSACMRPAASPSW